MMHGGTNELIDSKDSMVAEQMQVVCKNGIFSIPMNVLLAVSVVTILRNENDGRLLLVWLATVVGCNIIRFSAAYRNLNRNVSAEKTRRALRFNGIMMVVCGVIWAVVPAIFLDLASPHAAHLFFILAGISAGATLQSGAYAFGGTGFAVPIFAVLIVRLTWFGQESYSLALDASLYLALLMHSARRNEDSFARAVDLKTRATSLAISLDREHTASKAAAARFFELANHDPLTGLANRAAFSTNLGEWLDRAQTQPDGFSLFLLDLDHFKSINDTLGHSAGDKILQEAARRLASTIGPDQVVARLGGDEFAILLAPPAGDQRCGDDDADGVASRILNNVSGIFYIGEQAVTIGVSIGVAKFPEDGVTAENLLAHADLALYAAKDGGRHRWRRFDARLLADATMMRDIEHDLPIALAEGLLQVFYQPQIALGDHRLAGLEALLRWSHPVHGWIPPPMIVSAARRIRKSHLVTGFVLDQACRQIRRLDDAGITDVTVAVNVSPSELGQYPLPDLVRRSAAAQGIAHAKLEIEITEEAFAASEDGLAALSALAAMGVRLAIDDFGTGYSSIAYLGSMHVDRIKIDRSFVTGFADRAGHRILVQAILGIGRSLGIEVLAEGAETAEDVLLLTAIGCGIVQGYYFGRPMDSAALDAWMATREAEVKTAGDEGHDVRPHGAVLAG